MKIFNTKHGETGGKSQYRKNKNLNPVKGICLTEIVDLLQFLKLNLCKFLK